MSKSKHFSRNLVSIGESFNSWTVVDDLGGGNWLCRCSCGNEKRVDGYTLVKGTSKRCRSCSNKDKAAKLRVSGDHVAARQAWNKLNANARSRNLACSLSFEDFINISKMPCYYCGEKPISGYWENSSYKRDWHDPFISNGLDRYNNKIGYDLDNVVPCCLRCNRAKNDMSISEWLEKIKAWSEWAQSLP
jgi:hypothetical protein